MRWVNFRALRDLLLLVEANPPGLRARDLARIATDERVLLSRGGQALGRTSHYHHRSTLQRLGLLVKKGQLLTVNAQIPETKTLIARGAFCEGLDAREKEAFANAVLRNQDCHDAFFRHFLPSGLPAQDVETFVECAWPIELHVQAGGRASRKRARSVQYVDIRPAGTQEWYRLAGANAIQAVHFGLRSWCANQLNFLDVTYAANTIYTIYPKHIVSHMCDRDLALKMLDAIDFDGDWATIRVSDYALAAGIKQHVSVDQAKNVLVDWMTAHPDLVAAIPTRVGFITNGLPDSQHALALKGYLRSHSGAYVSHLRIHRMLRERVENGVAGR